MASENINGGSAFWLDGSVASTIDNGVPSSDTKNWSGSTKYWYQGLPQGYLQGGTGTIKESPENIGLTEVITTVAKSKISRAYAIII